MSMSRTKVKGRRDYGSYIAIPHALLDSANWKRLSPYAIKLLIDLYGQYKGSNNGDLCAAWSLMKPKGWRSKATLSKALVELQHYGFITLTRQGGRKTANLYAVTFQSTDPCKGKLDVHPGPPSGEWKTSIMEPSPKLSGRGGWGHKRKRIEISLPHSVDMSGIPHESFAEAGVVH